MAPDIDEQIAALLDEQGVARTPAAESKPKVEPKPAKKPSKASVKESPLYKQLLNEHTSLQKRFTKRNETIQGLKKTISALKKAESDRKKEAAQTISQFHEHSKQSQKSRVTVKHPDCNLVVRLTDNRIIIVFDEQFFITSLPLNTTEGHHVVLNGKCVDFISTLDEFDWINEQCSELGRMWRVEFKAPLLVDYVFDAPLLAILKKEGITLLHDAYLKAQEGIKGVGPKRVQLLKAAYDQYSHDYKEHAKSGKKVVNN